MARGDVPAFAEMGKEYLAETTRELVTWNEAWAEGDEERVALQIHRCKGGASLFAFPRLRAVFCRLEKSLAKGSFSVDPELLRKELGAAELALVSVADSV